MRNSDSIDGPCTWCGDPDHWRPDCPELRDHVKRVWRGEGEDRGSHMLGLVLIVGIAFAAGLALGVLIGKWWL